MKDTVALCIHDDELVRQIARNKGHISSWSESHVIDTLACIDGLNDLRRFKINDLDMTTLRRS